MGRNRRSTVAEIAKDDESSHIGGEKGGIPVMMVLCVMIMAPLVLCVVSTTAILTVSCDKSVRLTRQTGLDGVDQCFEVSAKSLEDEAGVMLSVTSLGVHQLVTDYILNVKTEMDILQTILYEYNTETTPSFAFLKTLRPRLYQDVYHLRNRGIKAIFLHTAGAFSVGYHQIGTPNITAMISDSNDNKYTFFSTALPFDGAYAASPPPRLPLQVTNQPVFRQVRERPFWNNKRYMWSSLRVIDEFSGFTLLAKHATGSVIGLSITLNHVEEYLKRLADSVHANAGSRGRIYTCVSRSWLSDEKKAAGDFDWEEYEYTHFLTGVSHGASFENLPPGGREKLRLVKDVEAPDPLIRDIALGIRGNYKKLSAEKYTKITVGSNTSNETAHLVNVRHLDDGYGLEWWLVSTIDLDYVVGRVETSKADVQKSIETAKDKTQKDADSDRDASVLIAAGVCVFFIAVMAVAALIILHPVKAIQVEMSNVADMQLAAAPIRTTSAIKEIRRMQRDFLKMISNLREYRAYVPSSVLEGSQVDVEPPTGHVALVFTDIEGSTLLWNENSLAMNTAIEIHNEVIRAAYRQFSGYEVKTIGDSFMLAFDNVDDAVECCITALESLHAQKWPSELSLPTGLRVRMGCNAGPTIAEHNPLTARIDYRGSSVNLASRVEGKANGASLCVTEEVRKMLTGSSRYKVSPHGSHDLKGLGAHTLHLITPAGMATDAYGTTVPDGWMEAPSTVQSESSYGGDRIEQYLYNHGQGKKTGLSLVSGNGTVAVCKLMQTEGCSLFDTANLMVRAATETAFSTEGVVGGISGSTLLVMWNCAKPVTLHLISALRFAADLERRVGHRAMRVGIASGKLNFGNVGTKKSRFTAVFGLPTDAAHIAASMAERLTAFCIIADCTPSGITRSDASLSSFIRPVDRWTLKDNLQSNITFYHLLSDVLTSVLLSFEDSTVPEAPSSLKPFSGVMHSLLGFVENVDAVTELNTQSLLSRLETLVGIHPEDSVMGRVFDVMLKRQDSGGYVPSTDLARLP